MAINFPDSPSANQTITVANRTWKYNLTSQSWESVGVALDNSNDTQILFNDGGVANGSSNLVFIKATGNVGIGTSSPTGRLEVRASINDQNPIFQVTEYNVGGVLAKIYEAGDGGFLNIGYSGLIDSRANLGGDAFGSRLELFHLTETDPKIKFSTVQPNYIDVPYVGIGTTDPKANLHADANVLIGYSTTSLDSNARLQVKRTVNQYKAFTVYENGSVVVGNGDVGTTSGAVLDVGDPLLGSNNEIRSDNFGWGTAVSAFGQSRYRISELNDLLFNAIDRHEVTINGNTINNWSINASDARRVFAGNYDSGLNLPASSNTIFNINVANSLSTGASPSVVYPQGFIYVNFYYDSNKYTHISLRTKHNGVWKSPTSTRNISRYQDPGLLFKVIAFEIPDDNYLTDIELAIETDSSNTVTLGPVNYYLDRATLEEISPFIDKRRSLNNLSGDIAFHKFTGATSPISGSNANTILLKSSGDVYVSNSVGIGTSSPTSKLHVNGTSNITSTAVFGDGINVTAPISDNIGLRIYNKTEGAYFTSLTSGSGTSAGVLKSVTDLSLRGPRVQIEPGGGDRSLPIYFSPQTNMTYADSFGTAYTTIAGTFAPVSGNGQYIHLHLLPTINQDVANCFGDYTLINGYVTETAANGANNKLIDLGIGSTRKFSVSNTGVMYVSSTVGIGTASPQANLHVIGSAILDQDLTVTGNLTVSGNTYYVNVSTYTVQDPLIYLAANNNLNDIVDIGFMAGKNTSGIYSHTGLVRDATDTKWKLFDGLADEGHENNVVDFANTTYATLVANVEAQTLSVATGVDGNVNFDSGTLFVDSVSNRVGIGTTSPVRRLHIMGDGANNPQLRLTYESGTSAIELYGSSLSDQKIGFGTSYGGGATTTRPGEIIYNNPANHFTFHTDSVERMRITDTANGGNVGIGTTSPIAKLDVNGIIRANDVLRVVKDDTNGAQIQVYGATESNNRLYIGFDTDDNVGRILAITEGVAYRDLVLQDGGGNVGIGTKNPSQKLQVNAGSVLISNGNYATGAAGVSTLYLRGGGFGDKPYGEIRFSVSLPNNVYEDYGATIRGFYTTGIDTGGLLFLTGQGSLPQPYMMLTSSGSALFSSNTIADWAYGSTYRLFANGNSYVTGSGLYGNFVGVNDYVCHISNAELRVKFFNTFNSSTSYIGLGANGGDGNTFKVFGTDSTTEVMRIANTGNVGIGTTDPKYKLEVNGSFAANSKSFVIDHPLIPNMKLQHGSLEGPEYGVYVRGRLKGNNVIALPDYWCALVDEDTITVNLTPVGKHQKLFVENANDEVVIVGSDKSIKNIDCYFTVYAERKDIDKIIVEY